MGLFSGCLLACDIDGTLLINGCIPQRNVEKIHYFMNEGGCFSLATGRTVGAVNMVLRSLNEISPSVVANGCMIYDYKNQKVLMEKSIDKNDYTVTKEILDLCTNVGIEVHSNTEILVLNETQETLDHEKYEELVAKNVTFDEASKYQWNKVVYLLSDKKDLLDIKKIKDKIKTSSDFVDTTATLYGRQRHYYEQTPKGVTKASALDDLCRILNIEKGCLYAAGDYYNDLEMIKKADIGAVPQESPDDIKQHADFIAGPCVNGAVADFIDYLTNIRKD